MKNNLICVFDFETDGADPHVCSPVQLAAVIVDPIKLKIIKDSEFNINFKPERLEKATGVTIDNHPYTDSDILEWHGKVRGVDKSQILEEWLEYPDQKHSWQQFISYLEGYHITNKGKKSKFTAPIACGYNINRFDMKIIDRLSEKYNNFDAKEKTTSIFHPRDKIDLMNVVHLWFMYVSEIKSISLDSMRSYLGISSDNAHDALKDVTDCANILTRFLRLHKNFAQRIQFKNSFAHEQTV
jgi:exonuclease I